MVWSFITPGPRVLGPKIAAGVLCVYALCYGVVLVILVPMTLKLVSPGPALFFGFLLALAATPFVAFQHLHRLSKEGSTKPAQPTVMALIMTIPAGFWLYCTADALPTWPPIRWEGLFAIFGLLAIPGILSLWLAVAFAIIAVQQRKAR